MTTLTGRWILAAAVLRIAALLTPRAAEGQSSGWGGTIEGSANVLFGAARGRLVSFSTSGERADSAVEVQADLVFSYADTRLQDGRREVTARSSRISLGVDYRPLARLSPFWFGSTESSLQQRIARRYGSGAGVKLTHYRRGDDDVSTSLALLGEHTRALDPDSTTPRSVTRVRWSLRFRVRKQLAENVRFSHVTFYQPSVARLGRYIADTNTSLAVALNETLALTATLRDRYDSDAAQRAAPSNHDGQLLFGLRASF